MHAKFKKTLAVLTIVAGPVMATATDCDTSKADKQPVVQCDKSGYKKAGTAAKAVKGTFFTCGGIKCKITYRLPDTIYNKNIKKTIVQKYPGTFIIPRNAKSWSATGCGTIYKKVR